MSNNKFCCIVCGAPLPNKGEVKQVVECVYCSSPNLNPYYKEGSTDKPGSGESVSGESDRVESSNQAGENEKRRYVLELEQSLFARFYWVMSLLVGVVAFIFICFHQQSAWVYLAMSVLVLLPTMSNGFVKSRWENVAKVISIKKEGKCSVSYKASDWFFLLSFLEAYVFLLPFVYSLFFDFVVPVMEGVSRGSVCSVFAFCFAFAGVWVVWSLIDMFARILGGLFTKKY